MTVNTEADAASEVEWKVCVAQKNSRWWLQPTMEEHLGPLDLGSSGPQKL